MFRGSVKGTGYPLHSPVSPSLPLPCVAVCHHISTGLLTVSGAVCKSDDATQDICAVNRLVGGRRQYLMAQCFVLMSGVLHLQ